MAILWNSAFDSPAKIVESESSVWFFFHKLFQFVQSQPTNAFSKQNSVNDLEKKGLQSFAQCKFAQSSSRNLQVRPISARTVTARTQVRLG